MQQRASSKRIVVNPKPILNRGCSVERADERAPLSPICACGIATAVYANVLLTLTLFTDPAATNEQLRAKLRGVEDLLQPLHESGQVWETVRIMAGELIATVAHCR